MSTVSRSLTARQALSTFAILFAQSLLPSLALADDTVPAPAAPPVSRWSGQPYDWTGLYAGGHVGGAWGRSWTSGPGVDSSNSFFRRINPSDEGGSWFTGLQGGYNFALPNGLLLGGEADLSAPSWPKLAKGVNPFGLSIGGSSTFTSPRLGAVNYAETVDVSGTARARVGYAAGDWLLYATGGLAWSYDQQSLTQVSGGKSDTPYVLRFGWTAGAGVETPIAPRWTARAEYLTTDYGKTTTQFFGGAQPVTSDLQLQEFRLGLNYHFGADAAVEGPAGSPLGNDNIQFHGQTTATWQGYHMSRSPYEGANSLEGGTQGREIADLNLTMGLRLWQGAELWFVPGIDQGFGLANTHGAAGFPNGEAYKLGATYPYARVDRTFVRQTVDLGGAAQDVDPGMLQFAGSTTADRVVLTAGRFSVADLFDTNRYANSPKTDFLNWTLINVGSFDYAGDAWGYTYGGAAEWYQSNWALRGGLFDMSATPTGAGNSGAAGYGVDPTFRNFEWLAEIERRHTLWGQSGGVKVTGFLIRGNQGKFRDALDRVQTTGVSANDALAASRHYQSLPGASLNLEQQVSDAVGVFARAGWADGALEPWAFTDVDRSVSGGVSLNGKSWGRPDDTIGVGAVLNEITRVHQQWLAAGGTGILVGDGQLPKYKPEKILETYYSYAVTPALKLTADYQFIADPAYNAQRGPVSVLAGRVHTEF